jgi:hypothetical protein
MGCAELNELTTGSGRAALNRPTMPCSSRAELTMLSIALAHLAQPISPSIFPHLLLLQEVLCNLHKALSATLPGIGRPQRSHHGSLRMGAGCHHLAA